LTARFPLVSTYRTYQPATTQLAVHQFVHQRQQGFRPSAHQIPVLFSLGVLSLHHLVPPLLTLVSEYRNLVVSVRFSTVQAIFSIPLSIGNLPYYTVRQPVLFHR